MQEFLRNFQPKKAPAKMDKVILAAAGQKKERGLFSKRKTGLFLATAATLLLSVLVTFEVLNRSGEISPASNTGKNPLKQNPLKKETQKEVIISLSKEAITAKAKLIEAKILRVRRLVNLTSGKKAYLQELDGLQKKLSKISPKPVTPKTSEYRVKLLEARLLRVRRLASLIKGKKEYLSELDNLQKNLIQISQIEEKRSK